MRPPPTLLAQPWWRLGRSAVPRMHRPSELKQSRARRASRRPQPQPERNCRSRRTHPEQERPLQATEHWELCRLKRRLDLWRTQAAPAPSTSSSTPCISSAQCYGTRGHGTPCLKSTSSRYWWPHASCGTTSKATPSRSSRHTPWRGYSGAPTRLEGLLNGTSSCRHFS